MISTASVDNPGLVCKSAHAGSIPASASTFESPADSRLRGFFMAAQKGDVFRKMKLKAVGWCTRSLMSESLCR